MADKSMGLEVEVSNIRFKFPKLTAAALAMPVLLLLSQIPNWGNGPISDPVSRPESLSQPKIIVEAEPIMPALPDYLEPTEFPQESLVLENGSAARIDSLSEIESSIELVSDLAPELDVKPAPALYGRSDGFVAGTCKSLKAQGLSPFYEGEINYTTKRDRDSDGIACE